MSLTMLPIFISLKCSSGGSRLLLKKKISLNSVDTQVKYFPFWLMGICDLRTWINFPKVVQINRIRLLLLIYGHMPEIRFKYAQNALAIKLTPCLGNPRS